MNKIILTTLVYILSFNFASSQVHPSSNSDIKDVKPYYTSVENLFSLEVGMTYDEVRSVLNAQPFNILNNLKESGMILEYKYMHRGKKVKSSKNSYYMSTLKASNVHYHDAHSAYLMFDESGNLDSYYTDAGTEMSEDVLSWENTLKIILEDSKHCENCVVATPKKCGAECEKACCSGE